MEYSEPELVIPALEILAVFDELTTTEIMTLLRQELNPTGADLEILAARHDDRFSQKVRNLTGSHRTLEKKGLATCSDGKFSITEDGRQYLLDHKGTSDAIKMQGFDIKDREKIADEDFKDVLIEEGATYHVRKRVRERSQKLINHAKAYFADENGKMVCVGCGFEGSASYGDEGLGLIEVHHLYPLYLKDGEGEAQQLSDALKGVVPLCPNCHRMVHRDRSKLMGIPDLQALAGFGPSSH